MRLRLYNLCSRRASRDCRRSSYPTGTLTAGHGGVGMLCGWCFSHSLNGKKEMVLVCGVAVKAHQGKLVLISIIF